MKYTLQVLKGRSDVTALRLIDGVNSVGRHDDCVIRIRSSQVSRRHCEIFEADDRLMVRDLGSSNGTYVNGLRVLGQQSLKAGDVITIGGVALRVDPIGGPKPAAAAVVGPDDATDVGAIVEDVGEVVDAVEVDEPDDFEISMDVAEVDPDEFVLSDAIPLEDEEPAPAPPPVAAKGKKKKKKDKKAEGDETVDLTAESGDAGGDDAVAQFLMDLKLDEND